jgi:hypothetical protein
MALTLLNLSESERRDISRVVGPLKSISEFCDEVIKAMNESPITEALKKMLPWAVDGASIVAGFVPLSNFVTSTLEKLNKETDPHALGMFACTIAYQRAAALAITIVGEPRSKVPFEHPSKDVTEKLTRLEPLTGRNLEGFRLDYPFAHPFIWQADEALRLVLKAAGYDDPECRRIQLKVHDYFKSDLAELLSDGETANRFEPFRKLLELGEDAASRANLNAHMERHRWQFEDRPLFNKEPFALSNVYVETDCGILTGKDLLGESPKILSEKERESDRIDPFSEDHGGRHDLLQAVVDRLGDPRFNRAIVIQGAAGAGKSAFTLRLAVHLMKDGLRPIRIRLRRLNLNPQLNILDALARVVLIPEEGEDTSLGNVPATKDPFLGGTIFQERTTFGKAEICPYILIFDGWDELSVGANEGFRVEVRRLLDRIDKEFLSPRKPFVRVILAGRPSDAIFSSGYLYEDTPIFTMRPYRPEQLDKYLQLLQRAVTDGPLQHEGAKAWTNVDWEAAKVVVYRYTKSLQDKDSSLDLLGLPLLAHLAIWLITSSSGNAEGLLADQTALYRHLVDLTCSKSGKVDEDQEDVARQKRIAGERLRQRLHETAAAITAYGSENISFPELCLRLGIEEQEAEDTATSAERDHALTALMISFYFKGGHSHLGCEFLHKSFREYLYAEGIVELVKTFGRLQKSLPPRRMPFHKEFQRDDENDCRYEFSRKLAQLLSPQKMRAEVRTHLERLIAWEIGRAGETANQSTLGEPLPAIKLEEWEMVRDLLADIWDWWAEAVHLRPQPYRDKSKNIQFDDAFVNELLDSALPRERDRMARVPAPGRLVNIDANLGEALFEFCVWVHYHLLMRRGWQGKWLPPRTDGQRNPCQIVMGSDGKRWVAFKPSGASPNYFQNYIHRINADGLRSTDPFPTKMDLRGLDLSGCEMSLLPFSQCDLRHANLSSFASLVEGAIFFQSNLEWAQFQDSDLSFASMLFAKMRHTNLQGAVLDGALLWGADLSFTNLRNLKTAGLLGPHLKECKLEHADLRGANLSRAQSLTMKQLQQAIGDRSTVLPEGLDYPENWLR